MQAEIIELARSEMEKAVEAFRHELTRVRTGRASTGLVEGLQVNYYGAKTPIRQVASLAAPEPRLIVITPYDKTALHEIEKAIQSSDLGLTPQNDGKVIRIPIPELTQERRKELVKHVKKIAEEHRVGVRNHRRDANDMLKE
ncbi:MAG TPA: ribosome recycling factor, partial [Candidatus Binataceae bacterium]|nr:ribosome recycling factor [Candidatus Binataceae bacterium]